MARTPAKPIVVDACEGTIEINVDQVTEPEFRRFSLTTSEARTLATALRHFANEVDVVAANGPRIVGLDLSLTATGIASEKGARVLSAPKGCMGMARLAWLRDEVTARCAAFTKSGPLQHSIDLAEWDGAELVVLEGYSFGTTRQSSHAHALGELGGIVRLALTEARIPWCDVAPAALKKFATGKGNANKVAMGMAASNAGYAGPEDDNAIDAWWLREMGVYRWRDVTDNWGGLPLAPTRYRDEAIAKIGWPTIGVAAAS